MAYINGNDDFAIVINQGGGDIDLSDYVKNTDYATGEKGGVVKIDGNKGIQLVNEKLEIYCAREFNIDAKENVYRPITPKLLDYATMKALTNPKKHTWTAEEKAAARATLGISSGGGAGSGLYLHTIAFNQSISSPEGEPFDKVYLFVITTDATPAAINENAAYGSCGNLYLRFEPSQILAAYGGWLLSGQWSYYLPVEIVVTKTPTDGYNYMPSTSIEHARILSFTPKSSRYEGVSTLEVLLDPTKFIGDTVTEI